MEKANKIRSKLLMYIDKTIKEEHLKKFFSKNESCFSDFQVNYNEVYSNYESDHDSINFDVSMFTQSNTSNVSTLEDEDQLKSLISGVASAKKGRKSLSHLSESLKSQIPFANFRYEERIPLSNRIGKMKTTRNIDTKFLKKHFSNHLEKKYLTNRKGKKYNSL